MRCDRCVWERERDVSESRELTGDDREEEREERDARERVNSEGSESEEAYGEYRGA